MDIRELRTFIAIAEEGSIHAGARRLFLAQPTASRTLQGLESHLGTALVNRSPRGITLTSAGTALLERAYELVNSLESTVDEVRLAADRRKRLTVGLLAGSSAASELTVKILQSYSRSCPEIELTIRELDFDNQYSALADHHVDAVLARLPCNDERLRATPLFSEPLVLAFRNDHRLAQKGTIDYGEFLGEPMLDMRGAPTEWTEFWHFNHIRNSRPPTTQSVRTLSEIGLALLSSSTAVMPVTMYSWRKVSDSGDLKTARIENAPQVTAASILRRDEDRDHVLSFDAHAKATCLRSLKHAPEASEVEGIAG